MENSTAMQRQEVPATGFGALIQQTPQPQGLTPTVVPLDRETLAFYGNMITAAGLVPYDTRVTSEVAKFRVMAKIVAGTSYGFDPVLSQQCFDIMFNALTPNARCMEILFKDSGEYDWRAVYHNETGCKLRILKRVNGDWDAGRGQYVGGEWTVIGEVEFTVDMAKKAGLWDKKDSLWPRYPADLSFARCVTRAVKRFNPGCMRPRTLLGNYFAKTAPQLDPPKADQVPQIDTPNVPEATEPAATAEVTIPSTAGEAYVDEPYVPTTEEDDGIEAAVVEYSGTTDAMINDVDSPSIPVIESEPVDPQESALIDLRAAVSEQLVEKVGGMPSDQKKILKGRVVDNMTADELKGLLRDLEVM